ncbi:hypothetical protein K1719_032822 [Acacia pycnantha]|nr:hypothetical protein K1719_032822 [Acacia pycnantha]
MMAENLGREPSVFELFKKTDYNEKTRQFADHRAVAIPDEFLRRKESINSEGATIQSNQYELNLWLESEFFSLALASNNAWSCVLRSSLPGIVYFAHLCRSLSSGLYLPIVAVFIILWIGYAK